MRRRNVNEWPFTMGQLPTRLKDGERPAAIQEGAGDAPRQSGVTHRQPLDGVSGLKSRYTDVAGP
jgi:hypothetical protein